MLIEEMLMLKERDSENAESKDAESKDADSTYADRKDADGGCGGSDQEEKKLHLLLMA